MIVSNAADILMPEILIVVSFFLGFFCELSLYPYNIYNAALSSGSTLIF